MNIFKLSNDLHSFLHHPDTSGQTLGFVPTMGALHKGHLQLLQHSNKQCQRSVVSIFINPTQFNNNDDFIKYPVTLEQDIYLLEKNEAAILFLPNKNEVYKDFTPATEYDIGYLENILEGEYRPGHFQGVCQVVDRLIQIVRPTHLFLGQKDFQQCMVIKRMVKIKGYDIQLVISPTIREDDGLAMSSRNMRLNEVQRKIAPSIYFALTYIKENINHKELDVLLHNAREQLSEKGFIIDYLEVCEKDTLLNVKKIIANESIILFAGFLGEIRLIDNMFL